MREEMRAPTHLAGAAADAALEQQPPARAATWRTSHGAQARVAHGTEVALVRRPLHDRLPLRRNEPTCSTFSHGSGEAFVTYLTPATRGGRGRSMRLSRRQAVAWVSARGGGRKPIIFRTAFAINRVARSDGFRSAQPILRLPSSLPR